MKRRRRPGAACVMAMLALTTTTVLSTASDTTVTAAFYADTSCLLRIDQRSSIGRTLIDADIGESDSRTLIHCDTRGGGRLTLLARSDEIGTRGRFELLTREAIDKGDHGFIAWLTRAGTSYFDETAPRRYVAYGRVDLRDAPIAQIDGAASHSSRQAFARIEGVLEPLLAHPQGQELPGNH